jgi:hypothetical protein
MRGFWQARYQGLAFADQIASLEQPEIQFGYDGRSVSFPGTNTHDHSRKVRCFSGELLAKGLAGCERSDRYTADGIGAGSRLLPGRRAKNERREKNEPDADQEGRAGSYQDRLQSGAPKFEWMAGVILAKGRRGLLEAAAGNG